MSSGECSVCGDASTLVDGLCRGCRLLQSAAKETVKDESSLGDLRRPFLEAFESTVAPPPPADARGPVPREVDTARRTRPGSATGKFTLVDKVGSGGVGDVWKAWDHPLHRWVALKFLKNEEEIDVARFEREARTVGQLTHPHIAPIFEVGKLEGNNYIAMQFVEGTTLQEFIGGEERLIAALVRDTALALQYAHEKGIVHRDVKPANIMVEELGSISGDTPSRLNTIGFHVYVMDFGLAKQVEIDSTITRVNSVLGTPAYMSPEQVEGKNDTLDHRTDVYSLGVTLYELFTGRPPFRASSTYDLFKMIDEEEPKSPRSSRPKLDRDLETIVMKCLEKDPQRRYESAQELADELTRWLDGDAILSHPPSTVYRVQKFVAKRKLLVSIVVAALLAVFGLSGFLLVEQSKKRSAEEDRIEADKNRQIAEAAVLKAKEKKLEVLRRETRYRLDTLLRLRRSGSREGVEEDVRQIEVSCDDVLREYPELAEPHYIKGRMYRAVLEEDRALREQNEAVRLDPGYAPALYERVVLEVQSYRNEIREYLERTRRRQVEQVLQGTSRRPRRIEIDPATKERHASRRQEIQKHLQELETLVEGDPSRISPGKLACAKGLLFWISDEREEAKKVLQEALALERTLEEGLEALATMESEEGRYESSIQVWGTGVERDKGYAPYYEGRGFAHANWGQSLTGKEALSQHRAAIADYDRALAMRPLMETWMMRGLSHLILGITSFDQRVNPEGLFEKAVADFDRAVEMSPEEAEPRTGRARAILVGAWYSRMMGLDLNYDDQYREAIRELDRALDLNASRPEVWSMRGAAKVEYATYLRERKEDPVFFYEGAAADYEESLKLDPNWVETYVRLGMALTQWGVALEQMANRIPLEQRVGNPSNRHLDPLPIWKRGEKAFKKAIEIDEKWGEAWLRLGGVRMHVGSFSRIVLKSSPVKVLRQAIEDINKAIRLGSRSYMTYWIRASCYFHLGRHYEYTREREKSRAAYQGALKDYQTTVRLNPGVKAKVEELIEDMKNRIK